MAARMEPVESKERMATEVELDPSTLNPSSSRLGDEVKGGTPINTYLPPSTPLNHILQSYFTNNASTFNEGERGRSTFTTHGTACGRGKMWWQKG